MLEMEAFGRKVGGAFDAKGILAVSRAFDFGHLVDLCRRTHEETRRSGARAVDTYLVTRNWLFGWYIVEYEQRGADRALYGDRLLAKASRRLQEAGVKGCSTIRLNLYRQFYQQHTGIKGIGPTLSDQFAASSFREFPHVCPEIRQTLLKPLGSCPPGFDRRRLSHPRPRHRTVRLPQLVKREVAAFGAKVEGHLRRMEFALTTISRRG